jgi:hypothetical protein
MQHLDEGTIHAWLDGELPPAEREALEAHIESCGQCAAAVAEARGFVAASSRILMALDAVPGGVLPASSQTSHVGANPPRFTASRALMAVAAVLVLSTVTVIATRSGSDASLAKLQEARATRTDAPVIASAPAPAASAPAPAATAPAAADKTRPPVATERKEARARAMSSQPTSIADAAGDAQRYAPAAAASAAAGKLNRVAQAPLPAPAARMDAKVQADSSPVSALAGQAPKAAAADSGRKRPALVLSQVVVTGAGTTSIVEKLGTAVGPNEAPQLLSRSSSTEAGDTVTTTIYAVRDGTVTLVERTSARDEIPRQQRNSSFSDQVMAKARDDTRINSLTWSDSSGHTRTLRGALPRDELERVRTALFGPTP